MSNQSMIRKKNRRFEINFSKFIRYRLHIDNQVFQFTSQNMSDIFGVMSYAQEQFDPFAYYKVEEYLIAYGLCVDTAYRGRGIATEMLKARAPLLKVLGLKVTTTAFTGIGSQKAAEKAGYEENFVIE